MKTPLGTEVDIGTGHIVLDGFPALRERGTAPPPPLLGPCVLWPRSPISATAELLLHLCHRWRRQWLRLGLGFVAVNYLAIYHAVLPYKFGPGGFPPTFTTGLIPSVDVVLLLGGGHAYVYRRGAPLWPLRRCLMPGSSLLVVVSG